MNTRLIIMVSVALNLLLGAIFAYHVTRPAPEAPAPPQSEAAAMVPLGSMAPARVLPIPVPAQASNFQWTAVESADFKQYMANLRAIGCPEETIRDLISAEVNKMFAPRFTALTAQVRGYGFWKPSNKRALNELRHQLQALQEEKRELLRTLLGIERDPSEKWANLSVDDVAELGRYGFLSADKEEQVRAIMDKYKQLESNRRSGDMISLGDRSKKLREQRREELAKVLTPEELHELDLRDSNTADSVRSRYGSADLTEEEYRKLFALRKAYEDEHGAIADNSDPEKMRRRSEARGQLDQAYKDALGDQRHAEIQKQQDPSWRGLTSVGQQHNLPQSTVDQAYQYQQMASLQVAALFGDPSIPRDIQRGTIKQIQQELENQLTSLMGKDAYTDFRSTSPQFHFSSGGDTMSLSGPLPDPGVFGGPVRVMKSIEANGSQADTRVTITVP